MLFLILYSIVIFSFIVCILEYILIIIPLILPILTALKLIYFKHLIESHTNINILILASFNIFIMLRMFKIDLKFIKKYLNKSYV